MRIDLGFLLAVFSLSGPVFAGGASSGGGRFAEQNIEFAAGRVALSVKMCLSSIRCNLTPAERATLTGVLEAIKAAPLPPRLKIVGKDEVGPDFFKVDGRIVNAKTEYRKDAVIYVNRDFLYAPPTTVREFVPAVDVPQAIGLLVHELSHQQGVRDEGEADLIGTKVRSLMAGQISEVNVFLSRYFVQEDERISAIVINPDQSRKIGATTECTADSPCVPQAFIHDQTGIREIANGPFGNEFRKIALATRCDLNGHDFNVRVTQMRFTNLHLRRLKPKIWVDPTSSSAGTGATIQEFGNLFGDLEFTCEDFMTWHVERFGKDQLSFLFGVSFSGGWFNGMLRAVDVKFDGSMSIEKRECDRPGKKNRCL